MNQKNSAEKLFLEEVTHAGKNARVATRSLQIGKLIHLIRKQLGMSQAILAKRAGVPQSTISRVENGNSIPNVVTLNKILNELKCDLVLIPVLRDSIENIRQKQARVMAERQVKYLKGTMNLENQEPDNSFTNELIKKQEKELLEKGSQLWVE